MKDKDKKREKPKPPKNRIVNDSGLGGGGCLMVITMALFPIIGGIIWL